jgi:hypothetical protein
MDLFNPAADLSLVYRGGTVATATLRAHGPYDPETYGDQQLTTLDGGCHEGEKYACVDDEASGFRAQAMSSPTVQTTCSTSSNRVDNLKTKGQRERRRHLSAPAPDRPGSGDRHGLRRGATAKTAQV